VPARCCRQTSLDLQCFSSMCRPFFPLPRFRLLHVSSPAIPGGGARTIGGFPQPFFVTSLSRGVTASVAPIECVVVSAPPFSHLSIPPWCWCIPRTPNKGAPFPFRCDLLRSTHAAFIPQSAFPAPRPLDRCLFFLSSSAENYWVRRLCHLGHLPPLTVPHQSTPLRESLLLSSEAFSGFAV